MVKQESLRPFRQRLAENQLLCGLFQCLSAFQVAEILSHTAVDFIMIEAEHSATSLPLIHSQVSAIAERRPVFVRLSSGDVSAIKPILDLGVTGIMVPDVRTANAAREIVAQTRFAPQGKRGIGGSVRASRYGLDKTYFMDGPVEPVTVILQIESEEGLNNIAEIASVEGVDAIFFGPMDLSAQLGHCGQPSCPEVRNAIETGLKELNRIGAVSGCLCAPDQVEAWRKLGMSLFLIGSDIGALAGAVTTMMDKAHSQSGESRK